MCANTGPNRFKYRSASVYLLAWLPVLLIVLDLKYTLLTVNGGGFELIAQLLDLWSSNGLSLWLKLAVFREDLLVTGLLAPALLMILLVPLTPSLRAVLISLLSAVASFVLFVELKCFWEVGTFLPLSVLSAGAAGPGQEYVGVYLRSSSAWKLLLLVGFTLAVGWAAARVDAGHTRGKWRRTSRCLHRGISILAVLLIVFTAALWIPKVPANPYQSSAFLMSLRSFADWSWRSQLPQQYANADPEQLLKNYRQLTNSPVPNHPSDYWGKAAGYDVISVVLETAPAQCVDFSDAKNFPNIYALRPHSFVAQQHYSTYPYTTRAVFSIYSSWYPSNGFSDFIHELDPKHPHLIAPGMVRSTTAARYRTMIFIPEKVDNWEHDRVRYEALGFAEQFYPADATPFPSGGRLPGMSMLEWRKHKDLELLEALKKEILSCVRHNQRYLFAFHPQYSHAPWPNVVNQTDLHKTCAEGLTLFRQVDQWIGEIVQLLKQTGTLDKTIIIITGDHGIRTRTEHASFNGGTLDDISFRVPLLIYVPRVVQKTVAADWITSHIDIAPSVLDLLGLGTYRGLEQGSPIWDPRLKDRMTLFLGKGYLGADGFYDHGRIFMYKYLFHGASVHPWTGTLSFLPSELVRTNRSLADWVSGELFRFTAIQDSWAQMMIPSKFRAFFGTGTNPQLSQKASR